MSTHDDRQIWFLTGSQAPLRRRHAPTGRRSVGRHRAATQCRRRHPVDRRVPAGADRVGRDPSPDARGQLRSAVRRRHHVDAHVLARQDVDQRPRRAAEADVAPPHAVERRPAVRGDRHGLHEPQPGRPRRPRVRPRPHPHGRSAQDGRRPRVRSAGVDRGSRRGRARRAAWPRSGRSSSPVSATTCAMSR